MIDGDDTEDPPASVACERSGWVRARGSGILHLDVHLGQEVEQGQRLGGLSDSFGRRVRLVHADRTGIVVGRTEAPLVNSGDAVVHIAELEETDAP
jgi:predicted deacylase